MRYTLLTLITLLCSINAWAAAPLTIDEAVREALLNNPQIHEQAAYREAAALGEKAARADFLPRLSAAYAYQNLTESPFVNIYGNQVTTNSRDQHHWEVSLSQPLFSGFAISARHRIAQLGLSTRELALQQTRQMIILKVKQRCFDLLMAEKTLAVAQSSTAALAAHEADVRKFYENGLGPLNDLLKAQVARAGALQRQHRAEADVRQVRAALCLLIGRDLDDTVKIQEMQAVTAPVPELKTEVDLALTARPEIALLEQSIQSKGNEQQVAKSEYYPRIELTGKYQQDGDDLGARNNDYTNQTNASVGLQARWTFFEFGKTRASAAKAAAEKRALEQSLAAIRDDIRLQVVRARLDLDVAARNIDTATAALEQAQEHWRITNLLYQQQLTTSTEVLDARSFLDRAQSAFHEAHYGYGAALAGLEWATGKCEPEM
jgi:outer membrane protein